MKVYLPWLAIPLALLLAGGLLPQREPEEGLPSHALTGERKGRSALKFHALTRGGLDATPLHTVNRPGLTIDVSIDPSTYKHMLIHGVRRLYKRRTTNIAVSFGGLKPCPAILRLRGKSSLTRSERVNFSIDLLRPERITPEIEMGHFYLVNMASDPLEFKLEFAYDLLGDLGLFWCFHQYVKVLVNGKPQGMFLLVERPRDAIRRAHPGTVSVIRRGRHEVFRAYWSKPVPFVRQNIETLKRLCREGTEDIATALENVIDLEAYLTWAATNSILENSDTVDELFFFEVRKDSKKPEPLRVMAWDYDEILQDVDPSKRFDEPLLFTNRPTLLAGVIREHAELGRRYRSTLRRLLTTDLTVERLLGKLREVHALRDRLDDGLAPEVQDEMRRKRRVAVDKFESDLRERHNALLDRLNSGRASRVAR